MALTGISLRSAGLKRDAEAGDLIDFRQGGGQLVAVALGHASGDDEAASVAPPLVEGEHRVDRLLAGRLDERARVDDDEVGRLGVGRRAQAVGEQACRRACRSRPGSSDNQASRRRSSRARLTRLLTGRRAGAPSGTVSCRSRSPLPGLAVRELLVSQPQAAPRPLHRHQPAGAGERDIGGAHVRSAETQVGGVRVVSGDELDVACRRERSR